MTDPDDETAPPCPLEDDLSSFSARYEHVRGRLDALAKPVGSLGTLEDSPGSAPSSELPRRESTTRSAS
ncbi:hypothetical protein THAOC_07488, partial [Thalassiosira oceanica]